MRNKDETIKIADIVGNNDELETLKALQMRVAQAIDGTVSARDLAPLVRQLRELTEEITRLGGGEYHDEIAEMLDQRLLEGRPGYVR